MFADLIKETIEWLDFDPKLKINIAFSKKDYVFLENNVYCINEEAEPFGAWTISTLAIMLSAKIVRQRAQQENKNLKIFARDVELNKKIYETINQTDDVFLMDARIIARIAGAMFEEGMKTKKIASILKLDADEIVQKIGNNFIEKACECI